MKTLPRERVEVPPVRGSAYRAWLDSQGLMPTWGNYVPDLADLPLERWPAAGLSAHVLNHDSSERSNDCVVMELAPGAESIARHHLYEQMVLVLSGRGSTAVWQPGGRKHIFEWNEGSLFAIPLNAWYTHFNTSNADGVRLLAVTNAPIVLNTFGSQSFVFDCDYAFTDRFAGGEDGYFDGSGMQNGRIWETNFVPDLAKLDLLDYQARGAGGKNVHLRLAGNRMGAHISKFPSGTYKKAHRHSAGAHVVVLSGRGYSLMWPEGSEPQRFDWRRGSLIIPPEQWFHQHFNIGAEPATYLALRYEGSRDHGDRGLPLSSISVKEGGGQIEYEDEDPKVAQMYRDECEKAGIAYRM
jgi:mannose-6-phosphate isomerase-like protein (cupin superfamily)